MPIRYMGTKRHIAEHVKEIAGSLAPQGKVVDLFSGMGCVAEALAEVAPVVTNDALSFTELLSRTRFRTLRRGLTSNQALNRLRPTFRGALDQLSRSHRTQLRLEQRAIDGGRVTLAEYMNEAEHVANSQKIARKMRRASTARGVESFCLTAGYFSAGYFSLKQALQLDALRYAIESLNAEEEDRDWLIGAWLTTAGAIMNAPGHAAQYLRPNTESGFRRIRRSWQRSVWSVYQEHLVELKLVGTQKWRRRNGSHVGDAIDFLSDGVPRNVSLVYADPPYTKDQYSRYYHVYETIYRYDFPDSHGQGRTRSDRATSRFCLRSEVESAFDDLFKSVRAMNVPLILSYPSDGLLTQAGSSVRKAAKPWMRIDTTHKFQRKFSTLGASKGSKEKDAMENLYVCHPN